MSEVDVKMRREIGRQFSMASVGADVKSACGVGSGNFYSLEIASQHTTLMINSLRPIFTRNKLPRICAPYS